MLEHAAMDLVFWYHFGWACAVVGWLIAVIAVRKAHSLWRTNGELAHRYHMVKKAYDALLNEHDAWCADEQTDPNGYPFKDL